VVVLDGAHKPGAKILVSGGGRCNVTNREVSARDFWGGRASIVRRILRSFPVSETVAFFRNLGVELREEADGKLFPVSGRARDVLNALMAGADAAGVRLVSGRRVVGVDASHEGFRVATVGGDVHCRVVVLATGGQSLPKSGSDGAGLDFARRFGHTIVPTTPALAPLLLDGEPPSFIHRELSGVSHHVELAVWIDGRIATRLAGSLLWTHFGISGPVVLNASRHWLRAQLEGRHVRITASFVPASTFDDQEAWWTRTASERPKASVAAVLSGHVPAAVASVVIRTLNIDSARPLAHLSRDDRRTLIRALLEWPLPVTGCRGWNYAEATAGGVALDEIDPATMASRICPGLYLVGEMLDVDGRIGGFNFQWAWSSAYVAGRALGHEESIRPRT